MELCELRRSHTGRGGAIGIYASGMAAPTTSDGDITPTGVGSSQVRRQLGNRMSLSHDMAST